MRKQIRYIAFFLVFCAVWTFPETKSQTINTAEQIDDVPVTDWSQENIQAKSPLRLSRDFRFNQKNVGEGVRSSQQITETNLNLVILPSLHARPENPFPTAQSDLVIIGKIEDSTAHLSADRTKLYSEFQVNIEKVIKGQSNTPKQITAVRLGGGLRFPSGKIVFQRGLAGRGYPVRNSTYLLFLKSDAQTESYDLITGYELRDGKVIPLDRTPRGLSPIRQYANFDRYINVDIPVLLNDLERFGN